MLSLRIVVMSLALGLCFWGCSDNAAPPPDLGYQIFPCTGEGLPCNAHDSCAINPTCQGGFCIPASRQNCDDGIACTADSCGSQPGLCVHTPKPGSCLIGGACYADGQAKPDDPCQICDPAQNDADWSGKNGGVCDDGDDCTADDYCQSGQCKGSYYGDQCDDGLSCTTSKCNGDGTCAAPTLTPGFCAISGACYEHGAEAANQCSLCDISIDPMAWTPYPNKCEINGSCYSVGQMNSQGCGVCNPTLNKNAWTPVAGTCLINGTCYVQGQTNSGGCASCEPSIDATAWTPVANTCLISGACYQDGAFDASVCFVCDSGTSPTEWTPSTNATSQTEDFDASNALPAGWTATHSDPLVQWQVVESVRSVSGSRALYYGDPAAGNYQGSGGANSGTLTIPNVVVPANTNAALSFNYWQDLEGVFSDNVIIRALPTGGSASTLWTRSAIVGNVKQQWLQITVDLSAYAGQTIAIEIEFDADSSVNHFEGVYIDDLTIITGCTCAVAGVTCQIGSQCFADQTADASGCRTCDAAANSNDWTSTPGSQTATTGFEGSTALPTGWTATQTDPLAKWQVVTGAQAHSGTYALYYGDPVAGNYVGGGGSHSGVVTLAAVTLPPGKGAALRFMFWHDMESATFDQVRVRVNAQEIWNRTALPSQNSMTWYEVDLDLGSYAGQTITIQILFEADSSVNGGEGAYIDDLTLHTDCP